MTTRLNKFSDNIKRTIYDSAEYSPNALPANERIVIRELSPSPIRPNGEYVTYIWRGENFTSVYMDVAFHFGERMALVNDLRNPILPQMARMNRLMADAIEFSINYLQD